MDKAETLLLEALRCALRNEPLEISEMPEQDILRRLFRMSREQYVLPLVVQAFSESAAFRALPASGALLREARMLTLRQARRTADFLLVLERLEALGLHPAVVKGAVCRALYPHPEQRPSSDEDLLCPPEDFSRLHEALLSCGLRQVHPDRPLEGEDEISYVDPERELYLEVHLLPFPSDEAASSELNRFLEGAGSRTVPFRLYGAAFHTLAPEDHLLFLLFHTYRHFLCGGIILRQIFDICLFSLRYSDLVSWQRIRSVCDELKIQNLAAAFFRIGERYLDLPCPVAFSDLQVDVLPLLDDCVGEGALPLDDPIRMHTARITLDAVAVQSQGRANRGLWSSLFPGVRYLKMNYPYAKSHPGLIPVAWANRIWNYLSQKDGNASKSLELGRQRVELLRQYKIIP